MMKSLAPIYPDPTPLSDISLSTSRRPRTARLGSEEFHALDPVGGPAPQDLLSPLPGSGKASRQTASPQRFDLETLVALASGSGTPRNVRGLLARLAHLEEGSTDASSDMARQSKSGALISRVLHESETLDSELLRWIVRATAQRAVFEQLRFERDPLARALGLGYQSHRGHVGAEAARGCLESLFDGSRAPRVEASAVACLIGASGNKVLIADSLKTVTEMALAVEGPARERLLAAAACLAAAGPVLSMLRWLGDLEAGCILEPAVESLNKSRYADFLGRTGLERLLEALEALAVDAPSRDLEIAGQFVECALELHRPSSTVERLARQWREHRGIPEGKKDSVLDPHFPVTCHG